MHNFWEAVFGPHATSHTITALQMTTRALLLFFAALALLRASGRRTFGGHTAFDMVVKIMLGAVLSRGVAAASPLGGTLLAGGVLVGLHRLLAWAAFHSPWVGRLVKGEDAILVENGRPDSESMRRNNVSESDLLEGLRESAHLVSFDQAETVRLERSGSISVVKKPR